MIEFPLNQQYDQVQFLSFLKKFLPDDYVPQVTDIQDVGFQPTYLQSAQSLGECRGIDLQVYVIHHSSLNDARVGISKDAFRLLLNKSYHNRALIAFVPNEGVQWRLSLLQMEAEISDKSARITRSYSNPRRYSFLLGEGAHVKTPHQFLLEKGQIHQHREGNKNLTEWEDLLNRFSVEVLTKDFYDKLFDWYTWAIDPATGIYFPNNPTTTDDDRDNIDVKIIRLITRLMFVWFIKQKQLVPDSIFHADFVKSILKDFDPMSQDSGVYYNAILQNLFFASLNRPVVDDEGKERDFRSNHTKHKKQPSNLFRFDDEFNFDADKEKNQKKILELFGKVPYLNAGLFECLDKTERMDGVESPVYYDGFSSNDKKFKNGRYRQRAFIPNILFFAPEKGLLEILSRYNFTVEENTPVDQQVALDPELLGKVFENLLGAYNPETKETARNSTGSFYTPREIVQYMVDESLIAHLKLHVGNELEPEFRKLLSYTDDEFSFTEEQKEGILKAIYNCKVLDPACGSGAFPMGMLQQMVHIISRIDTDNTLWKDIVLERALVESKEAFKTESKEERQAKLKSIEDTFDQAIENPDYTRKLYLIENCIYGVDIQPIAMMISKLRFFISLVCEQENINPDDEKHNFGVNTLPNLETKFVAANTLLNAEIHKYTNDWTNDEHLMKLKDELLEIRHRHFYARKRSQKENILKEDLAKRDEITNYILTSTAKPDEAIIKRDKEQIRLYFEELCKYREPKMEEVDEPGDLFGPTQKVLVDVNASKRREIQGLIKACEEEIRREENKKNPKGFVAAVKQVTDWNPYNQNSSAPFLDIEWMFGMKEGFDIVIGNPPYIQLQANGGELARLYEPCGFETFDRKGDIYCLFYERGNNLLKNSGLLCYITSNKWMRAGYGDNLRNYLATRTNPIMLIDFGETHVFESATVMTNILIFKNEDNLYHLHSTQVKEDFTEPSNIESYVDQNHIYCKFEGAESWVIMPDEMRAIKKKVEAQGETLEELDIQINYGIKTGYNPAFIIDEKTYRIIHDSCKTPFEKNRLSEIIRPLLRGKDIRKYGHDWNNAKLRLINSHNGVKDRLDRIVIEDYPSVKAYMKQFIHYLEKRSDKGDTPYNLRSCAYVEDFDRPKIIYPEITKYMPFFYDENSFVVTNTAYMLNGNHLSYLTAFLNSSLFKYCFKEDFAVLFGGARRMLKMYIENLIVKDVDDVIEAEFRELVLDIQKEYSDEKAKAIDKKIFDLYGLTKEERELIGYIDFHNNGDSDEDDE